jgi:hypothetical protein
MTSRMGRELTDIPASAFRLQWHPTWTGAECDFTARKDAGFCRIYHEPGGPNSGRWFWTAAQTTQLCSGHAETAKQAALAAESVFLTP